MVTATCRQSFVELSNRGPALRKSLHTSRRGELTGARALFAQPVRPFPLAVDIVSDIAFPTRGGHCESRSPRLPNGGEFVAVIPPVNRLTSRRRRHGGNGCRCGAD
jgi:hypothetical protein